MKRIFLLFFILLVSSSNAQKQKHYTLPKPKWEISGRFDFIFNQPSFSNWISECQEGKRNSFSLGFNFYEYYKFRLMENVEMANILTLYSDYLSNIGNTDLDYQTNIHFKLNEYLKMQMTFHTIVDDNASSKIQFRQLLG